MLGCLCGCILLSSIVRAISVRDEAKSTLKHLVNLAITAIS